MVFLIKFERPRKELAPFESRFLDAPIVGRNIDDALATFNKFLGRPFGYKVINVSVIGYEDE